MSDKGDNPDSTKQPEEGEGLDINITVDKSKAEEELKQQLEKERQERQKEKEEANKKIQELGKQLEELEEQGKEKDEEYTQKLEEADEVKKQLAEIVKKEFETKKNSYIEALKKSDMEEEKVQEIADSITTPAQLDEAEMYLTMLSEMFAQAQEQRQEELNEQQQQAQEQAAKDAKSQELNRQQKGGGVVEIEQEKSKDGIYNTVREGIDDIYDRRAKGDKQAQLEYNQLWTLAMSKLREKGKAFAIVQCPQCEGAIYEDDDVCVYCGYDPKSYRNMGTIWSG